MSGSRWPFVPRGLFEATGKPSAVVRCRMAGLVDLERCMTDMDASVCYSLAADMLPPACVSKAQQS